MEHIWSRLGQSVLDWPKLETPLLLMSIKLESSNFYQQINESIEIKRLLHEQHIFILLHSNSSDIRREKIERACVRFKYNQVGAWAWQG